MLTSVISIIDIFSQVQTISNNCKSLSPEQLDLQNKNRTSILPWRGQFSPELIELFLKVYAHPNDVILDPFAGSGTTLFEAARQGLSCYGTEINPAAVEMAKTAHFVNIQPTKRQKLIKLAEEIIDKHLLPFAGDLFFYGFSEKQTSLDKQEIEENLIIKILQECDNEQILKNLLINAIINYHQQNQPRELIAFRKALQKHINIIKSLPYSPHPCQVIHQDARNIPLSDNSIDIVITSPPYINVFNYHQNNRITMEMLGWNLLTVAKSEIGANRKHRQNRFLTVIQYALDILDVLKEIHRLIKHNGRVIIVVGRESNIRGVPFKNGTLLANLAVQGAGFKIDLIQERKFKNKFGKIIYEDILHLVPEKNPHIADDTLAIELAKEFLTIALENIEGDIYEEIINAKNRANLVQKSPIFKTDNNVTQD
ncbi:MAG: hypothetical protein RLZZ86_1334 [Cyanobacteriota bacterium]